MLDLLIIILVISWICGFTILHAGSLIHALLVLAFIVLIIRLIQGVPPVT